MLSFSVFIVFIFKTNIAYAYLDPGSASVILQLILSSIATVLALIGIYYIKVKNFIKKIFRKNKKNK